MSNAPHTVVRPRIRASALKAPTARPNPAAGAFSQVRGSATAATWIAGSKNFREMPRGHVRTLRRKPPAKEGEVRPFAAAIFKTGRALVVLAGAISPSQKVPNMKAARLLPVPRAQFNQRIRFLGAGRQ